MVVRLAVIACLLAFLVASSCAVYLYRDAEDWGALTLSERGIIQNYVKCKSENKQACEIDPRYIKSGYTISTITFGLAALDVVKKNTAFHETAKVLLIGLGPGTIGRYWHHYFPNMEIDYVEISEDVVLSVNQTMPFPNSPNFRVIVSDALLYVKELTSADADDVKRYDLIVHDAYDQYGPAAALNTLTFFNGLRKLVEGSPSNGVVVSNMWALDPSTAAAVGLKYKEVFGNVRIVGTPKVNFAQEQNVIVISHSTTRKDDLECTDKVCRTKRSKSSRTKPSPICQEIDTYVEVGRAITTTNAPVYDLAEIVQQAYDERPFPANPEFC